MSMHYYTFAAMFRKLISASSRGLLVSSIFLRAFLAGAENSPQKQTEDTNAPTATERKAPLSEAELAIKSFQVASNLQVSLFADDKMLQNPVCFSIDEHGRFFVGETFRLGPGVIDNRKYQHWIDE